MKQIQKEFLTIYYTWKRELRKIFRDPGVLVLLILAPLAYPVLYACIYKNEVLRDVPIAVVDQSATAWSRKFIQSIDATPEVCIAHHSLSLSEARKLYEQRKVHGILIIPSNFQDNIYRQQQAHVSVFTDMSSFMYYASVMGAVSTVSRDIGLDIQLDQLKREGLSGQQALVAASPFTYSNNIRYNPTGGYASFLLPAILILILHQTLLMGVGMLAGTDRERSKHLYQITLPGHRASVFASLAGKALCYLLLYAFMAFYVTQVIPRLFHLPLFGKPTVLLLFMLPFLLSTTFLALTLSAFFRSRESSMLILLFSSVPLLFISGISWPSTAIPSFWHFVGWFFPSTHGITGYVKINTMQAGLSQVGHEYQSLWLLAGIYFLTAYLIRIFQLHRMRKTVNPVLA